MTLEDRAAPPHSLEAERAVLGGLMLDNTTWDKLDDRLHVEDFSEHSHRLIFAVVESQSREGEPSDVVTISDILRSRNELEDAGGMDYLIGLSNATPSAANVGAYSAIVRERAQLRMLDATAHRALSMQTLGEKTEILATALETVSPAGRSEPRLLSTFEADHRLREERGRHATYWPDLDKFGMIADGEVCIVAARTNVGKSKMLLQLAYTFAHRGEPVLYFNIEDSGAEAYSRMLKAGRDPSVALWLDEETPLSLGALETKARRMARVEHIRAVFVDYIQLVEAPGDSREERVARVSHALKALAKRLSLPVYAAAQLNRVAAQRNGEPELDHMRESGAIEMDANLVWILHQDERYPDTMEVHVKKNKSGPKGSVLLHDFPQRFSFESAAPGESVAHFADKSERGRRRGGVAENVYKMRGEL